jgi:predicted alpha/beta-hydrolase family hydrolase
LPTVPHPRDIEAAARHPPVSPPDPARPARVPFNREAGEEPAVRGTLHAPADAAEEGLVLTHGAGASSDSPLLVALADVLAGRGFVVLRCDLPFRQARPHGPPSPAGAARDRTGLRAAVGAIRGIGPQRVDLGGHSYGGRQASLLAAEDPSVARALLLLSYPLHPPGRPGELRVTHFPRLRTPALFVLGTADPFGSVAEFRSALTAIPAPTALHLEPGVGHDLGAARRSRVSLAGLATRIADHWLEFKGVRPARPAV